MRQGGTAPAFHCLFLCSAPPVDVQTASRRCSPSTLSRSLDALWQPTLSTLQFALLLLVLMGAMCDGVRLFTIHVSSHHIIQSAMPSDIHNSLIIPYPICKIAIAIGIYCHHCHYPTHARVPQPPSSDPRSTVRRLLSAGLFAISSYPIEVTSQFVRCLAISTGPNSWEQLETTSGLAPLREIGQSECVSECVSECLSHPRPVPSTKPAQLLADASSGSHSARLPLCVFRWVNS